MYTETIKLDDVITDIAAGPFGSNLKVSCFVDYGFPIVDGANLKSFKVTDNITKYVTEEKARSLHRSIARRNDVVVTISGTLGQIAYIPENSIFEEYLCSQRQFRVTFDTDRVYVPYLVYYFHSREGQHKILSFANQTGVPALSQPLKNFRNIEVNLPDINTQKRIASVLNSLDDKVELNTKINENLEQQAQAIFKSWFIDFEPFGGVMPGDWMSITLNDVCTKITDGSHYSPKDNPSATIPMLSVKDMRAFNFDFRSCKHIDENEFEKMIANDCVPKKDDILVAKDGSYLKEIFICNRDERYAILSSIAIFRPDTSVIIPEILLALLKSPSVLKEVRDNYVSGSALPRIVLKDFKKLRFILPPLKIQSEIAPLLHNIRLQIDSNCFEIQQLSALRDTLLPKLMNGEIDVSQVQI